MKKFITKNSIYVLAINKILLIFTGDTKLTKNSNAILKYIAIVKDLSTKELNPQIKKLKFKNRLTSLENIITRNFEISAKKGDKKSKKPYEINDLIGIIYKIYLIQS